MLASQENPYNANTIQPHPNIGTGAMICMASHVLPIDQDN
jgi:hypothetical protein